MWPLLCRRNTAEVRTPYPKSMTKKAAYGNGEGVLGPIVIALG